jgi:hypothetical protein
MRENFEVQKDEFLNYVDQWDKAQEKKIFGDISKASTTSSQTSDVSFFGPIDTSPSENPNQNDLAYWSAIYQTSLDNLASNDNNILSEEKISRQEKSPNPIRSETEGKDQDLKPQQLGVTFDEEDIKGLEEMKVKLHELQSKIAVMNDDKSKDIQKQINSLQNQIDEISTSLGQAFSSVKK